MVRHKNRYIVVEVRQENSNKDDSFSLFVTDHALNKAIIEKLQQIHGDFGVAACRTGYVVKYCNKETGIAVIRVRHGPHKLLTSVLPLVNQIDKKKATLTILYIGATIKKCFEFLINYHSKMIKNISSDLKSKEEKDSMRELCMNLNEIEEFI